MRLGQTSVVHFSSKFLASILGFVGTIYFARILGSEPLGKYFLTIGVVSWLGMVCTIGVSSAIVKRVSEGAEQIEFAGAGAVLELGMVIIISVGIMLFESTLNAYIGYPAAEYVVLILFVRVAYSFVSGTLNGLKLVHVTGILSPVKIGGRTLIQIAALLAGLELVGLFLGYIAGLGVVSGIGLYVLYRNIETVSRPKKRHFRRILSFAKFSWLGNVSRKTFNWVDVVILGAFVPAGLVAIYSVAWNIGQFLSIFGTSLSVTLFPEMSETATSESTDVVADYFETSLAFAGIFLIPGLVGAAVLSDRLLRIYGGEFTKGGMILVILVVSLLVQGYRKQFINVFNAMDRPDIAFRVNGLLIVANIVLNVTLIYLYGWIGAAIATTLSVTASLVYAFEKSRNLLQFSFPLRQIGLEWTAAVGMGAIVFAGRWLEDTHSIIGHNFATVLVLIGAGAITYFGILFVISPRFRVTVLDNVPLESV